MIDSRFRVAPPPVDMALSPLDVTVSYWLMGICTVFVLIALAFALREWQRCKSPVLLLLVIGGGITNLAEPFVDLVGACWHPIINNPTLFEHMDRPMPVWLVFAYFAYFGALMMCLYHAFSKGTSTKAMWLWFIIPIIADVILEESLLGASNGLYAYYGNQPLRFNVFPAWWAPANTAGIYMSAVLMTLFVPHLRGWKLALVPFSTLLCYAAASGVVSFPAAVVINSEFPNWATQLGGVGCFVIAALIVKGCTLLIASDSPFNVRKAFAPRSA